MLAVEWIIRITQTSRAHQINLEAFFLFDLFLLQFAIRRLFLALKSLQSD